MARAVAKKYAETVKQPPAQQLTGDTGVWRILATFSIGLAMLTLLFPWNIAEQHLDFTFGQGFRPQIQNIVGFVLAIVLAGVFFLNSRERWNHLAVDPDGFTVCRLGIRKRFRWCRCSEFFLEIHRIPNALPLKRVTFDYSPEQLERWVKPVNRVREIFLPSRYRMPLEQLCGMMNDYRTIGLADGATIEDELQLQR